MQGKMVAMTWIRTVSWLFRTSKKQVGQGVICDVFQMLSKMQILLIDQYQAIHPLEAKIQAVEVKAT